MFSAGKFGEIKNKKILEKSSTENSQKRPMVDGVLYKIKTST